MNDSNQGLQANPQYTIHYLSQEITRLTQENAMLKAYIQEQNEKSKSAEEEQSLALFLYKNLRRSFNMANEIIKKTERFILVQIDKEGTERVLYQDFVGSFTTSDSASYAQDFKSEENAKKIAETLNLLYQLTGNQNGVKVVKEVVDRTDLSSDKSVDSETM
ncbi:phi PVL ORF 22-like protein [Staphylococcus aureus]|jgi:hypothetical protein|nr:phi PVL ORF 22-like protein [Staphylococcus aureus]